jgi:hypothetical protein
MMPKIIFFPFWGLQRKDLWCLKLLSFHFEGYKGRTCDSCGLPRLRLGPCAELKLHVVSSYWFLKASWGLLVLVCAHAEYSLLCAKTPHCQTCLKLLPKTVFFAIWIRKEVWPFAWGMKIMTVPTAHVHN